MFGIANLFGKMSRSLKTVLDDPIVDHGLDWLGDYVMGHAFWEKKMAADGTQNRGVNPAWIRRESPKIFAQTHLDENLLREITYSSHLAAGHRTTLFDNWGPSPVLPADPGDYDPLLGEVGPHQWDDIRLSLVEELVGITDDAKRQTKIKELGETLTEIAQLEPVFRLRRFIRLHYCKPREDDYRIVKVEQFFQRRFENFRDFQDWLISPDPTGFRIIEGNRVTQFRTFLENCATNIVIPAMDNATVWLRDNKPAGTTPVDLTKFRQGISRSAAKARRFGIR